MSVYEKAGMDPSIAEAGVIIIAVGTAHIAFLFAWLPSVSGNVSPFGIGCSVLAGGSTMAGAI